MMKVEVNGRSLRILLGERVLASHSPAAPMLATAAAAPEIRENLGGWSVQGRMLPAAPLSRFEWEEATGALTFLSNTSRRWVRFILTEMDGAVELRLDGASQEFGRLALHLHGSESAVVRGGGDAGDDDLRGQKPLIWAAEPGSYGGRSTIEALRSRSKRSTGGSAAPQAFFHDSDGFFAAIKHAGGIVAEVGRNGHRELEMWGLPEAIYLGFEEDAAKRLGRASLIGAKRVMPPRWSVEGVTVGVVGGEEELLRRLDSAVRAGLRPTAAYIRDWSGAGADGAPFEDYSPSNALYPRMAEILERLRARGIRAIARVAPMFSVDSEEYGEAARLGYLLADAGGAPALSDRGGMVAHIDLENAEARAWTAERLRQNVFGVGFAAVQAEGAECEPSDAVSVAGRASNIHNRRAALWLEVCGEAAKASNGAVFAASGAALGLAPVAEVCGSGADWELGLGVRSALEALLALAAVGVGAAYCDAGAQFHRVPKQLRSQQIVRWAEMAAFTPHFRLPALAGDLGLEQSDLAIVMRMAQLHAQLAPYIAVCMNEFVRGGLAPIRRTTDVYPELAGAVGVEQFLLGRDMVVAPACDLERNSVEVTLPDGAWVHLFGGGDYTGGRHTVQTLPGNPAAFYRRDGEHATFFRSVARGME